MTELVQSNAPGSCCQRAAGELANRGDDNDPRQTNHALASLGRPICPKSREGEEERKQQHCAEHFDLVAQRLTEVFIRGQDGARNASAEQRVKAEGPSGNHDGSVYAVASP